MVERRLPKPKVAGSKPVFRSTGGRTTVAFLIVCRMDPQKRLKSLDTLRGFDMMFIMGVATLIITICEQFPGGADCWLAQQMDHVEWNGWHHHDTIFPLFLFISGISFPFSYAAMQERGMARRSIYWKIFRRAALLVLFGLICNGLFKLEWSTIRIPSVLARIGLAWMFAALMFINFKPGIRAVISAVILLGYWFLLMIPAPDAPGMDPLSHDGNLVGYIDRMVMPNHLYRWDGGNFDPEGILSTLPAIVTAMLGMFTGEYVRSTRHDGNRKTLYMFAAAAVMLILGYIWNIWFPINKKLWTSSFVLVLGAFSLASFALFYWIIDIRGRDGWTFPFRVIGMNSITIFMAPRVIDFHHATDFFMGGIVGLMPEGIGSIVSRVAYLVICWLFLYFLYRKKIFLKL